MQRPEPEVCVKPPGFEENLVIRTDPEWLRWVMGQSTLRRGDEGAQVEVEGSRRLVRMLRGWSGHGTYALATWEVREHDHQA